MGIPGAAFGEELGTDTLCVGGKEEISESEGVEMTAPWGVPLSLPLVPTLGSHPVPTQKACWILEEQEQWAWGHLASPPAPAKPLASLG